MKIEKHLDYTMSNLNFKPHIDISEDSLGVFLCDNKLIIDAGEEEDSVYLEIPLNEFKQLIAEYEEANNED